MTLSLETDFIMLWRILKNTVRVLQLINENEIITTDLMVIHILGYQFLCIVQTLRLELL